VQIACRPLLTAEASLTIAGSGIWEFGSGYGGNAGRRHPESSTWLTGEFTVNVTRSSTWTCHMANARVADGPQTLSLVRGCGGSCQEGRRNFQETPSPLRAAKHVLAVKQ
jgi:hypothetical protein